MYLNFDIGSLDIEKHNLEIEYENQIQKEDLEYIGYESGIITWFNEKKGYGFIFSKDKKYFFHISNINSSHLPKKQYNVKFKFLTDKQDRLNAIDILILESNFIKHKIEAYNRKEEKFNLYRRKIDYKKQLYDKPKNNTINQNNYDKDKKLISDAYGIHPFLGIGVLGLYYLSKK